jgi:hypothetical protein
VVGGGRQGETEGGGLRERWIKAAEGGHDGSQGPKRMDNYIRSYYFYTRRTWHSKRKIGWRKKSSD